MRIKVGDIGSRLIVFLINPFAAFLLSIVNIYKRSSRVIIFLWFVLFGFMFLPFEVTGDSYRYYQEFTNYQPYQFSSIIGEYFSFDSNVKDLYSSFSFWLIKSLTDNYHFLFAFWAIVFGFFYIKSLKYATNLFNNEYKLLSYILILFFMFSNPIYNINGVRFWTASWIGVYCAFKIFHENKYQYILLALLTIFVHGSFIIYLIILLLGICLQRNYKFVFILYALSFFFTFLSVFDVLDSFRDGLPTFIGNYIDSYMREDVLAEKQKTIDSLPLYARVFHYAPHYFINILCSILLFEHYKRRINLRGSKITIFMLLVLSISNISSLIAPAISVRFIQLSIPIIVVLWMLNIETMSRYKIVVMCIPLVFSYSIYYWLKDMYGISDLYLYILPTPISVLKNLYMF